MERFCIILFKNTVTNTVSILSSLKDPVPVGVPEYRPSLDARILNLLWSNIHRLEFGKENLGLIVHKSVC
jgi:hypothetical protein